MEKQDLAIIEELWDRILIMYQGSEDEKPIFEYDARTQEIAIYEPKVYFRTLRGQTRNEIKAEYVEAVKHGQVLILVKETKHGKLQPYRIDVPPEDLEDDFFAAYEGQCQTCDRLIGLDDMGLCRDCAEKFERDVIRQRQWEYSGLAFGTPPEKLEELRDYIISQFGAELELLSPNPPSQETHTSRKQKGHR